MRCHQLDKIVSPPEHAILLAEPRQFSPLLAGELTLIRGLKSPRSMRACLSHLDRLLMGMPTPWATAVQLRFSPKQSSTASGFCSTVK